jgi:hypothetical protein
MAVGIAPAIKGELWLEGLGDALPPKLISSELRVDEVKWFLEGAV